MPDIKVTGKLMTTDAKIPDNYLIPEVMKFTSSSGGVYTYQVQTSNPSGVYEVRMDKGTLKEYVEHVLSGRYERADEIKESFYKLVNRCPPLVPDKNLGLGI